MIASDRSELLELICHLRNHAASARVIGSDAEAAAFEAKVDELKDKHQVTEQELNDFDSSKDEKESDLVDPIPEFPKLNCFRVLYSVITLGKSPCTNLTQDGHGSDCLICKGTNEIVTSRHGKDSNRYVVATTDRIAGNKVLELHPGFEVQIQQVATIAKDVVIA